MKKILFLSICSLSLILAGCARLVKTRQLMTVAIGMTKNQVITLLGEPIALRGSMINKSNQIIEVWEYYVKRNYTFGADFLMGGDEDVYWFYFYDSKLVQWCKAGDWDTAAHDIQEIRFR